MKKLKPNMDAHEITKLFPQLNGEEYEPLKQDIQRNGLQQPIHTYEGKIIDGRSRYRACVELGITPEMKEWDGAGSLVDFVVSLNLHRRHLSSSQRAVLALRLEEHIATAARARRAAGSALRLVVGQANVSGGQAPSQIVDSHSDRNDRKSAARAAAAAGTNRSYIAVVKRVAQTAPDLLPRIESGALTVPDAKKLVALEPEVRQTAVEKLDGPKARNVDEVIRQARRVHLSRVPVIPMTTSGDLQLLNEDIRNALDKNLVAAESCQAVITDPPYGKEYVPLYETLAELAAKVLVPGGSLVVMTGQSYLPEILSLMSKHLTYRWCVAYLLKGSHQPVYFRRINVGWKPVIWFTKEKPPGSLNGGRHIYDIVESPAPAKHYHEWEQSEVGTKALVERFSSPGDTVLDPFLGSGTTGVVALKLGRRFIGIENDEVTFRIAKSRISKSQLKLAA